jgi:hypothetical protein
MELIVRMFVFQVNAYQMHPLPRMRRTKYHTVGVSQLLFLATLMVLEKLCAHTKVLKCSLS